MHALTSAAEQDTGIEDHPLSIEGCVQPFDDKLTDEDKVKGVGCIGLLQQSIESFRS